MRGRRRSAPPSFRLRRPRSGPTRRRPSASPRSARRKRSVRGGRAAVESPHATLAHGASRRRGSLRGGGRGVRRADGPRAADRRDDPPRDRGDSGTGARRVGARGGRPLPAGAGHARRPRGLHRADDPGDARQPDADLRLRHPARGARRLGRLLHPPRRERRRDGAGDEDRRVERDHDRRREQGRGRRPQEGVGRSAGAAPLADPRLRPPRRSGGGGGQEREVVVGGGGSRGEADRPRRPLARGAAAAAGRFRGSTGRRRRSASPARGSWSRS